MIERVLRSLLVVIVTAGTSTIIIKNAIGEVTFWGALSVIVIVFVMVKSAEYLAFRRSEGDTP